MKIHDNAYKRLFSNLVFFRQLVQTFVEEEWVQELDFAQAERVNKSFISEHYKETESDLIYKVPWRGKEVYFYILLEFQSTIDPFMTLRVLVSTLFIAETHFNLEQLVEEVTALFEREEDKAAASLLVNWLAQMAIHGKIEKDDFAALEQVYRNSVEVKTMIQTAIAREKEQIRQETIQLLQTATAREKEQIRQQAIQLGESKGIQVGMHERNRQVVHTMLAKGLPLTRITDLLSLSLEEVQTLLDEGIGE